jgi:hypothetical protein
VYSYLIQPHFRNHNFSQQVTGTDAQFLVHDKEGMHFFIPKEDYGGIKTLEALTKNPDKVQFEDSASENELAFVFPKEDFIVDPERRLNFQFPTANYDPTVRELTDFILNRRSFNGYLYAVEGYNSRGEAKVLANHLVTITKPGEPSLTRFSNKIIEGATTNEERAQRLLDFVTGEIAYGGGDNIRRGEVLKRPNEVLMTGATDCSGKVILYSSLLNQQNIGNMLAYTPGNQFTSGHISVAVQGNFPANNDLTFTYEGARFSIAETTSAGFVIGETRLYGFESLEEVKYLQKMAKDSPLVNSKTGKPLEFLK